MQEGTKKHIENKKKLFGDLDEKPQEKEHLTHIEHAERKNVKLYETQRLMETELERMRKVNIAMHDTSEKLNKTDKTYGKYGENLSTATKVLHDIYRTQIIQNIVENAAMYFFFCACIYIFCERFYIWELMTVVTNVFFFTFGSIIDGIRSFLNLSEEDFSLTADQVTNEMFKQNV
ncbi:unnamed protein product [Moneuplotes crassus]|uniref:Uncharacterized protein n=1 Tax=Euplotes crassus TaxID=5936 RepID=A0AAD1Y140_EUPCR|nr:unnamed protein product [Moneuplotes crassus]